MEIKIFEGFEDIYPKKVEGTNAWYIGKGDLCSEPCEVPTFKNKYPGTKLYFIEYPSGKVFEPIKQEINVYLESPVYENKDNSFGIIRYDFNSELIQVIVFYPESYSIKIMTEIPFKKVGDMINVRLISSPFTLVKHYIHNNSVDFLWPNEKEYKFEENESLYLQNEGKLYLTKWIEDPDYHEEIIVRDSVSGEIIERNPGYWRRMPDGFLWKMTSK